MQEQKLNINEVIKVESLPKIFYQLEQIGKVVNESLKDIDKMECNEENKAEVKRRKQEITAFKNVMEERRKEIKNQIMSKYNEFNAKYEEEIKDKLIGAEKTLSEKYLKIENEQKLKKEKVLRDFVEEHCKDKKIHIDFERIGLNITLSASEKSLKEQALKFIEKVASDLKLIELEEYSGEILLEYNENLDFAKSKLIVVERHKQIEEIQKKQEELAQKKAEEEKVIEAVEEVIEKVEEEITAPVELIEGSNDEEQQMMVVAFQVTATVEQIRELKQWLKERNIQYE